MVDLNLILRVYVRRVAYSPLLQNYLSKYLDDSEVTLLTEVLRKFYLEVIDFYKVTPIACLSFKILKQF